MENPEVVKLPCRRRNLCFSVVSKKETKAKDQVAQIVSGDFNGQCGIVYCARQADTVEMAFVLKEKGISATYYHAGMEGGERIRNANLWLEDKINVICCTNAFGMGIDKRGVRFVIHLTLPSSLEDYIQESGRGGRDGDSCSCVLLFCFGDRHFIFATWLPFHPMKPIEFLEFPRRIFICHFFALKNIFSSMESVGIPTGVLLQTQLKQKKTLSETRLKIAGCRHGLARRAVNMIYGEIYGYAHYLQVNYFIPEKVEFLWYDVVCKYWPWLKKNDVGAAQKMKPALSVMHAKAHSWSCQALLLIIRITIVPLIINSYNAA